MPSQRKSTDVNTVSIRVNRSGRNGVEGARPVEVRELEAIPMEKTVTRGPLFKIILKEFAAPLVIATLLLVVLLYGHMPL